MPDSNRAMLALYKQKTRELLSLTGQKTNTERRLQELKAQQQHELLEENHLRQEYKELSAYLASLKNEEIEQAFKRIKKKISPEPPMPNSVTAHFFQNLVSFEVQMKVEWADGKETYVRNTMAALSNAVDHIIVNDNSLWKRDIAIKKFQNTARESMFTDKTKAFISLMVGWLFFLVGCVSLYIPDPTLFAVVGGVSMAIALVGVVASAIYSAIAPSEWDPDSQENMGKEVYVGLKALARERSKMHGHIQPLNLSTKNPKEEDQELNNALITP